MPGSHYSLTSLTTLNICKTTAYAKTVNIRIYTYTSRFCIGNIKNKIIIISECKMRINNLIKNITKGKKKNLLTTNFSVFNLRFSNKTKVS